MKGRIIVSTLLALLLLVSMPMSALAATWDIGKGDITVNAESGGQTVRQGGGAAVPDSAPVITGTSKENNVTINAERDQTANVTLSGVNIDVRDKGKAAVSTTGEGNVSIELNGESTLRSGYEHAGLEKNNGGSLTIADEDKNGKLTAWGGQQGAGIGGGSGKDGSNIFITGGGVNAIGGLAAAGIGGGNAASGRAITVSGGYISVEGAAGAEGFGSGKGGAARSLVSITGGLLAEAAAADGSIYGVIPASASSAMANLDGNTKNVYPTLVLPVAQIEDPIIQLNASTVYTGTAITPGDVIKSAAYGSIDAKNAVALEFVGGDVPVAVGEYKVSASLAAKQDGVLDAATAALTGTYYRAATIDQIFEITPRSSDPTVLASTGDNPTGPVALLGIVVCVAAVTILATRRRIR